MSAYKLVQQFEDRTDFPVTLDEVRDAVIGLGGSDAIRFKAVDIKENVLRGICYRYKPLPRPYASPEEWIDIVYAETLTEDWRRLVITKELVHVLDKDGHRTRNEAELDDLVRRMARRADLRDGPDWRETSDRVGLFQALGILFPFASRKLIKEKYDQDHISDEMIAHRAMIPVEFVSYLMSNEWEASYDLLMQLCEVKAEAA